MGHPEQPPAAPHRRRATRPKTGHQPGL